MNIEIIAAAIEAVFYSGRVKAERKLDRLDFLELAKMAHAGLMRKLYFENRELEISTGLYFGDQIETREFELGEPDSKGRRVFDLEEHADTIRLPNGLGIFSISPASEKDCGCSGKFMPAEAGSEWLYCGKDFAGVLFFIKKGRKIYLYNAPDCLTKVEVDGIFNDENVEIPDDIAFDVVNLVLGTTLQWRASRLTRQTTTTRM
jgi:hypothetical protein